MKRYAGLTWLMRVLARRFRVLEGMENIPRTGPCILACNHVGSPDPIFIMSAVYMHTHRSVSFVTYDEVVHVFGSRVAYSWLGMVKKEEDKPGECLAIMRRDLAAGHAVGIFPEGMRNAAPFVLPGKTGVARLAHWSGAPVVPLGYTGPFTWTVSQAIWSSLSPLHNMNLRIGQPMSFPVIQPENLTKDQLVHTTRTIMAAIGELAGHPSPY
jgi:1-acyl-sn-glycerol-3-phosphate acyltransferase